MKRKVLAAIVANRFVVRVWQKVQLKMSLRYYDRWEFLQNNTIFMLIFLVEVQLMDLLLGLQWPQEYILLYIKYQLITMWR